jgi:hypothetical protein
MDSRGGEALANVSVRILPANSFAGFRAVSDTAGRFRIEDVPQATMCSPFRPSVYHVVSQPLQLSAGQTKEFEVVLGPDNLARTDALSVTF